MRAPPTDTDAMGSGGHVGASLRPARHRGSTSLRTRLDLAAVEVELYLIRVVQMLLWAVAALACALLALVFGLVSIVVALWDSHRMLGLLGGTGLFLVLAVIFGAIGARTFRSRPTILDGTSATTRCTIIVAPGECHEPHCRQELEARRQVLLARRGRAAGRKSPIAWSRLRLKRRWRTGLA